MDCVTDESVERVFDSYPPSVRNRFIEIRELIREAAIEEGVVTLQECLRWGEPSFIATEGSAIRLGWKAAFAEQYSVCSIAKLVWWIPSKSCTAKN